MSLSPLLSSAEVIFVVRSYWSQSTVKAQSDETVLSTQWFYLLFTKEGKEREIEGPDTENAESAVRTAIAIAIAIVVEKVFSHQHHSLPFRRYQAAAIRKLVWLQFVQGRVYKF